jgi:predicted heme/steroid binding protein
MQLSLRGTDHGTHGQVTWEELAEHNTPEDLWVAIRGKVYDLTTYQNRHPGGFRLMQLGAGRDVTHLFEAYHPLRYAHTKHPFVSSPLSPVRVSGSACLHALLGVERHVDDRDLGHQSAPATHTFFSAYCILATERTGLGSVIDSDILKKFEIGELTTQEYPSYPPMSPFYRTLKQRVATYMTDTKQDAQFSQVRHPSLAVSRREPQ